MPTAKKPAPRKPMAPRKPTTGVRKPLAKPTRNSGPVVFTDHNQIRGYMVGFCYQTLTPDGAGGSG